MCVSERSVSLLNKQTVRAGKGDTLTVTETETEEETEAGLRQGWARQERAR